MATNYVCPVCEYAGLIAPIEDSPVCPSCGTEFEIDDRYKTHGQLRNEWLDAGAPWFSALTPPPANWDEHRSRLLAMHGSRVNSDNGMAMPVFAGPASEQVLSVRCA